MSTSLSYTDTKYSKAITRMKKTNEDTKSYIKLKCFNMYKSGADYQEIARKLKISVSIVDEYILAHASLLKIDLNKIRQTQEAVKQDEYLIPEQVYKATAIPVNNISYNPSEPLPAIKRAYKYSIPEGKEQSWFQKAKTILCQIICFWK